MCTTEWSSSSMFIPGIWSGDESVKSSQPVFIPVSEVHASIFDRKLSGNHHARDACRERRVRYEKPEI